MNTQLLTHSHSVYKAKKKAKRDQINEIVFDDTARYEYLTGFRKRNILKKEAAVKKAKEREHQERLEARREHRRILREQAIENAAMVEKVYKNDATDDEGGEEFTGFSHSDKGKGRQKEEAYEDEEHLATVTVIEEFDPDSLIHPTKAVSVVKAEDAPAIRGGQRREGSKTPRHTGDGPLGGNVKGKDKAGGKKRFTYETKAARKAQSTKQRARRTEKAERAGGRSSTRGRGRGSTSKKR